MRRFFISCGLCVALFAVGCATVEAYQDTSRKRFLGVMGTWFPLPGE